MVRIKQLSGNKYGWIDVTPGFNKLSHGGVGGDRNILHDRYCANASQQAARPAGL